MMTQLHENVNSFFRNLLVAWPLCTAKRSFLHHLSDRNWDDYDFAPLAENWLWGEQAKRTPHQIQARLFRIFTMRGDPSVSFGAEREQTPKTDGGLNGKDSQPLLVQPGSQRHLNGFRLLLELFERLRLSHFAVADRLDDLKDLCPGGEGS